MGTKSNQIVDKRRKLSGHTPPPWKLFGAEMDNARYWVGTREGRYIASVGMIDSKDRSDSANARLIVAAPKMLVVLKQLLRDLRVAKANCLNRHPHSAWVRIEEDWNAIIERTEEMIREAERQ